MKQNADKSSTAKANRLPLKHDRRKQYIINPAFQWKYISIVAGGVFVASCLMSTVLYGMVYYQARERLLHLSQAHSLQNTFGILIFSGAFALLMAAGFAVWTTILTHRIGGPIHVMMNYFADLSNSKIPRVRPLRTKDEFKTFHDAFRRAADSLRCDREAEIKILDESLELANKAGQSSESSEESLAELVSKLKGLHMHVANMISTDAKPQSESSTAIQPSISKTEAAAK